MKNKVEKKHVRIAVTDEMSVRLKELATKQGKSVAELVEELVVRNLKAKKTSKKV